MEMVVLQAVGVVAFLVGTVFVGVRIRQQPTAEAAHRLSQVMGVLYWLGLVAPVLAGVVYPGLTRFDAVLGLPSLPPSPVLAALGWVLVVVGALLVMASSRALKVVGSGFPAFVLTTTVVHQRVYQWLRNPMSLGWYLQCIGVSLIAHSTYLLVASILVEIPVHLFYLVYFEEHELRARYGPSYEDYRARVPFLIPSLHR
jgi:protein-S-isoprenylcysteine O-methyltransferase Ste14